MTLPGAQAVLTKGSKNSKSGSALGMQGSKKQLKKQTKDQRYISYEDYVERSETYKTNKDHLKKQKNHLNKYV
jgi:hypothetical protein